MPLTRLQARQYTSQLRLTTQEDDTPPTSPEADETPSLPPTPRLRHVELPRPRASSAPVLTAATRRRLSDTSEFSPLQTPPPSPPPGLRVVSAPLPRGSPETNPEFHQLMWRAKQELACTPHDPSPLRRANTPISSPQTSSGGSRGSSSPVMIETSEILCRGEDAVESLVPELGSDNEEEWIEDVSSGNFGPQKWVHLLRPPRSHSKKDRRRTPLIEASDRPVGSPKPSLSPEQASELHEALSESDMRKCSVALFRPTASEATSTSAKRSTVKYPRRSVSLSAMPDKNEDEAELFLRSPVTRLPSIPGSFEPESRNSEPYIGPPRPRLEWAFRNTFHRKLGRAKDDPINPILAAALQNPSVGRLLSGRRSKSQRGQGRRRAQSMSDIDVYSGGRLGPDWRLPREFGPGHENYLKRIADQKKEAESWRAAQRSGYAETTSVIPRDPSTPRIRNVEPATDEKDSPAGTWLKWQRKDIFTRKLTKNGLGDRPVFSRHLSPSWESLDPLFQFRGVEAWDEEEEEEAEEVQEDHERDSDEVIAAHTQQLLSFFGYGSAVWGLGLVSSDTTTEVVLENDSSISISSEDGATGSIIPEHSSRSGCLEDQDHPAEDTDLTPDLEAIGETPPEPVFLTPHLACESEPEHHVQRDDDADDHYIEPTAEERAMSRARKGKFRASSPSPVSSPTWEYDEIDLDKDPDVDFVLATKEAIQRSRTDFRHTPADDLQTSGAGRSESFESTSTVVPSTPPEAMSDPEEQYEDQLGSVFDLDVEFVANEEFESSIQQALWGDVQDSTHSSPEHEVIFRSPPKTVPFNPNATLPRMVCEEAEDFWLEGHKTKGPPDTMSPSEPADDPTSPTFKRCASPVVLPDMPARRKLRFEDEAITQSMGGFELERSDAAGSGLGSGFELSTPLKVYKSSCRSRSPDEEVDPPREEARQPGRRFSVSSLGGPLPPTSSRSTATPVVVCFPPTPRPEQSPVIRRTSKRYLSPKSARQISLDSPHSPANLSDTDSSELDVIGTRRKSIEHGEERPDLEELLREEVDLAGPEGRESRALRPRVFKRSLPAADTITGNTARSPSPSFAVDLENGPSPPDLPSEDERRPQITLNPHIWAQLRDASETTLRSRRRDQAMSPEEVEALFSRLLPPDYDPLARASTTVSFRPTAGQEAVRRVSIPQGIATREQQDALVTQDAARMMRTLRWVFLGLVVIVVLVLGAWQGLSYVKMVEGRRHHRQLSKYVKHGRRGRR